MNDVKSSSARLADLSADMARPTTEALEAAVRELLDAEAEEVEHCDQFNAALAVGGLVETTLGGGATRVQRAQDALAALLGRKWPRSRLWLGLAPEAGGTIVARPPGGA